MTFDLQKKFYPFFVLYYLAEGLWFDFLSSRFPKWAKRIQNGKLRKMMRYCYSIPFYRERFDRAGVKPEQIRTAADLQKLPVLTKAEYRAWMAEQTKNDGAAWSVERTSGSTGTPMVIYKRPMDAAHEVANLFRSAIRQKRGYRLFLQPCFSSLLFQVKNPVVSRIPYVYQMSSNVDVGEIIEQYNRIKPGFYYGNKTQMVLMAQYALRNGIRLHQPNCAASVSEVLDANARAILKQAFGERAVFDLYGCSECGNFAVDTAKTPGRHTVWGDCTCVRLHGEITNGAGDLAITSLIHYGFPLVNYLLGDRVALEEENGFPVIGEIVGRSDDLIRNADGTVDAAYPLLHVLAVATAISQFRIVQTAFDQITVLIAADGISDDERTALEQSVRSVCAEIFTAPNEKNVTIEWHTQIPRDKNGKLRRIVCRFQA